MKETKIEKLILDLSNRWDCSPQEAVDRLNSMNESEINKLINSMTKKFQNGGMIDCLRAGGKTYAECKKCGGKTPLKAQTGATIEDEGPVAGRIPRSSMFDAAREFMPDVDRKFVRQAYRAAKRQGRAAGNTGTYLRQDARDRVIEKFRNYADNSPVNRPTPMPQLPVLEDVVIEDEPIVINDVFQNLDTTPLSVQKMDKFGGSFSSAFGAARRSGLREFEWNGKRYTTDLAPQQPKITSQPTTGEIFNGRTTGGAVAPVPSTDAFYNAGSAVREWFKEQQPIRSAISAIWDPHPEPLPTHDRKAASQQMVRDYLNENSPRAKARLKK